MRPTSTPSGIAGGIDPADEVVSGALGCLLGFLYVAVAIRGNRETATDRTDASECVVTGLARHCRCLT
ncbi:hypothetical protein BJ958_002788 [Nocardioides kongjuensis]|uniref:Uncharacterized protein n=1 Tax=Nocardioides kongjuensis TaxID=349522 RepID=A0A852RXH9_9ACTN|nr:hypothetical protein [Nocardioides kongjuensis]